MSDKIGRWDRDVMGICQRYRNGFVSDLTNRVWAIDCGNAYRLSGFQQTQSRTIGDGFQDIGIVARFCEIAHTGNARMRFQEINAMVPLAKLIYDCHWQRCMCILLFENKTEPHLISPKEKVPAHLRR